MSTGLVVVLGLVAGLTIYLGLPVGRMRGLSGGTRAFLNAVATGILLFLFFDVLEHGVEPVDKAISDKHWGAFAGYAALFLGGIAVGLLSLVWYDRWSRARRARIAAASLGPGAAHVAEFAATAEHDPAHQARRLAMLIATGIGLHNFAEGLAIGQSAASGAISLAVLLVIGFGLHNATEGFGIVAPMSAAAVRPSWGELALLGAIGGGPTFLGTVIGQAFVNDALSTVFLALAAGSILYVVVQLVGVGHRLGRGEVFIWGLLAGLVAGFATDFVVSAAGI